MRVIAMRLAVLALLILMFGCATVGKNFSSDGVTKMSIGNTTENEIFDAFGEPFKRQSRSENGIQYQLLVYAYAIGTPDSGKARQLDVEFTNGLLNAYLFHSALEGDSTDFDIDARSKLNEKKVNQSDVTSLMGRPHGEIHFPSVLLKKLFGSMPEVVPPAGASKALLYYYSEVRRESGLLNTHAKLLIVYITSDGSVIETRHFMGTL